MGYPRSFQSLNALGKCWLHKIDHAGGHGAEPALSHQHALIPVFSPSRAYSRLSEQSQSFTGRASEGTKGLERVQIPFTVIFGYFTSAMSDQGRHGYGIDTTITFAGSEKKVLPLASFVAGSCVGI